MKKKLLFAFLLVALFVFALAITSSAEAPSLYIEFDVKLQGSNDYIKAYTENTESGNPKVNLTLDFYSDLEFTQVIDKSQIVAMDFSSAVHYGNNKDYVDRFNTADPSLYPNCEEIKWFSRVFTKTPSNTFNGWTQLKRFDFGCITTIDYGFLASTGLEEVVLPAQITKLYNGVFSGCASLKTVKIEGAITSIGSSEFQNCVSLVDVDLGQTTAAGTSMFKGCTSLVSIKLSPITTLPESMFQGCTSLTTVDMSSITSTTSVGSYTFSGCTALVSIELPPISKMSQNMFSGCTSLATVDLSRATGLTEIGKFAFSGCTALKTIISSGVNQEGAVIIPHGVTWIGQEAFYNCDSVKYLSLPSTVTYLGPSLMRDSSGLQFVDFNENANAINLDNWGHFSGCSGLKAVSLPDGIVTINNRFMTSCTSLKAVYLPANLEQMNTNGNGQGPFCYSSSMYFVQEPFEVRDENGYFYGDSFAMPEKPEVYFMPTSLERAGGNASSGTWFRDCFALNKTIVMPEGFTNSTVVQMFRETASASNIKNVVYLGDMETIAWSERNHHINFIFANPNDKDINSIEFTSYYNNLNNNCYFYFCSTGKRYTMNVAVDKIAETLVENTYNHVANPNATVKQDETCVTNRSETRYCFCTAPMGTVEVENTALGHEFDLENGATFVAILYNEGFGANGCKQIECARCDTKDESQAVAPIFEGFAYSTREEDGIRYGMVMSYVVNTGALSEYETVNNTTVTYGVLAIAQPNVSGNPLASDGSTELESITATEVTGTKAVDLIIWGSKDAWDGTLSDGTAIKDLKFYITGYVIENAELNYFCGTDSSKSLTDLNAIAYNEIKTAA